MADDQHEERAPEEEDPPTRASVPLSRLGRIGKALAGPVPSAPLSTAKAVNELDERERRLTLAALVLGTGLVIAGYLVDHHSHQEKVRAASSTLLIAGIVVLVVMVIGLIFRRRAMVGFASFMVGFALITGGNIFGALFLVFGGWLLVRAMRRQRGDAKPGASGAASSGGTKRKPPPKPAGPPKPSKRYTPPRGARVGSRRR